MKIAISKMLEALSDNLFEYNLQRCVDFGHTWSPALELSSKPLLHGYAVNIDMAYSSSIARTLGLLDQKSFESIILLMRRAKLPLTHPLMSNMNFLIDTLESAKIHRDGALNLPLPDGIGQCIFINDLDETTLKNASELYQSISEGSLCY